MPKLVQLGIPLLHGMIGNRLWNLAVALISSMTTRGMETLLVATFAITPVQKPGAQGKKQPEVQTQILLSASSSWDGEPYRSYPSGQPELSVLKITLAPHTQLEWRSHPMPSAAYIVAGELTLERRKRDGKKQRSTAGQVVSETIDTFHRGVAGNDSVVLIVVLRREVRNAFYPASASLVGCHGLTINAPLTTEGEEHDEHEERFTGKRIERVR